MRDLPIGTILKTPNGYVWRKINFKHFQCIGHKENAWKIGDIYISTMDEEVEKGDRIYNFITYYKLCKKQVKS
jgi:hypothetical protein